MKEPKQIKRNPSVRYLFAVICMFLVGISACSPSNTNAPQMKQTELSENKRTEPETSEIQEEPPEAVQSESTVIDRTEGFGSPRAAVTAYLEGLRAGNLNYMIDTFAVGNYIDNYISALKSKDMLGTGEMTDIMAGAVNVASVKGFYRGIAIEERKSSIADDILRQYSLICRLNLDSNLVVLDDDREGIQFVEELSKKIKTMDLKELKVLGFLPLRAAFDEFSTETYQETMTRRAQYYGADQVEGQIAVVDISGEKSILVFELAEYDGRWYNLQLGGLSAGMLGIDAKEAGTMVLNMDDGERMEQGMRQYGFLSDSFKDESMSPIAEIESLSAVAVIESEGFSSPEEAVVAYLEGLKANDLDCMMSVFAVESYVENYGLPEILENVKGYCFMRQEFNLPVVDRFSKAINIQARKKTISNEIVRQFEILCLLYGDYYGNSPLPKGTMQDGERMRKIAQMADAVDFGSLKILGYIPPGVLSESYDLDGMQELRSNESGRYGASDLVSCVIAFEIEGNKYVIYPEVMKYNGKWYIKTLKGQLSTLLSLTSDLMGTMPIDAQNMPELENAIIPFEQ